MEGSKAELKPSCPLSVEGSDFDVVAVPALGSVAKGTTVLVELSVERSVWRFDLAPARKRSKLLKTR